MISPHSTQYPGVADSLGGLKTAIRSRLSYLLRDRRSRLFAVGDSHSDTLSRRPRVKIVHLGPVTAYRAGRRGELVRLLVGQLFRASPRWASPIIIRVMIRPRDAVLLFFGEIDVRAHFAQRLTEYGSAEETARFLAQRLSAEARDLGSRTGALVGIASVTPPVDLLDDPDLPTRGSPEQRVLWTRLMNQEFAAACQRFGLVFVDTYERYANSAGVLLEEVSDGTVHIRQDSAEALFEECLRQFPAIRTS